MDKLNKDELIMIALILDLPDLLVMCKVYNRFNEKVCKDPTMWQRKILRDYPQFKYESLSDELKKKTFQELYTLVYLKKLLESTESLDNIYLRKEIDLSHKKLKKFPEVVLPNLEELYLDNNLLENVPAFNLPKLQRLYLDNNLLKDIPNFNLPNLQKFFLHNNRLSEKSKQKIKTKYSDKVVFNVF
jgi:Leucine-rich repeat (LRR) protein